MSEPLNFAILTTKSTNQCKVLSLEHGVLVKESIANCFDGYFLQCQVSTLEAFADVLDKFTAKQSLILGTPHRQDGTALQAGEKINLTTKNNPTPKAIPRSKDFIQYRNHAGFMLFDIDGGGTYDQLVEFIPELQGVGALIRPSSSSFIYDDVGNELAGAKGWHIFIPVLNLKDVERIAPILWGRMWLAGHGHYLISKGLIPQTLERGIYDKAVLGAPERLAFEAAPMLKNGLMQRAKEHTRIIEGSSLDTSIIADLTPDDLTRIEALKQQAKETIKPDHQRAIKTAKRAYIAKSGKPARQALTDFSQLQNRELTADFLLYTAKGERLACTLSAKDDGLTMTEPFEPDYDGGSTTKAKFFWNSGKPLINSQAHGGIKYSLAFMSNQHNDHAPLSANNADLDGYVGELLPIKTWQDELLEHVERFNKNHAQVVMGGKHRIMRIVPDTHSPDGRETLEFFSQSELAKVYQNRLIKTGEKMTRYGVEDKYQDHITAWAKHHKCRSFRGGVIFKPNAPPNDHYFNTWRGFSVEPKPAKNADVLEMIYQHIEQVICSGEKVLYTYLYNWFAYIFQHPDRPAGAAVVCRGLKGTGKGIIGTFIKDIWGVHALALSQGKHFTGNFNGHLASTCFVLADEAFFAGDKSSEGVLKALITDPYLMIEQKGIDAVQQPNYLKVFMTTNSDYVVPASKDERRYFVVDVSDKRKGDTAYFNALATAIADKEVQAAFLYEMLQRDITGFHTGNIPETQALKDQRLHSLNSVGKWLVDCLHIGGFEHKEGVTEWEERIPAKTLYNSYLYWCDTQKTGEYNRVNQTAFGRYLNDIGFSAAGKSNGSIMRRMLQLVDAVALFETKEKVTVPTVPKLSPSGSHEYQGLGIVGDSLHS